MPKGVLGDGSVAEFRGPMMDLMEKVQGQNGRKWFEDFKKFLRKQFVFLGGDGRTKEQVLASPQFRWATAPEEVDIELVEFDNDLTSEQVLAEFAKRGLEEPTEEDALRFGEKYPDVQNDFPIVFLHKANLWRDPYGPLGALVLYRDGAERELFYFWFDFRWLRYCRFAARRLRK